MLGVVFSCPFFVYREGGGQEILKNNPQPTDRKTLLAGNKRPYLPPDTFSEDSGRRRRKQNVLVAKKDDTGAYANGRI